MKRSVWNRLVVLTGMMAAAGVVAAQQPSKAQPESVADRLVIHEWGTFTCLEDEKGRAIPGVNTDDEPVPEFVHRISDLIAKPTELAPVYYKGVPCSHRQVRMRLETPVVYFYPPRGVEQPLHASVQVGFRGGWLTEYFPHATVSAPGLKEGRFRYSGLNSRTQGTLDWHDLTIGGDFQLPQTDAPVWLAPRQVRSAKIKAPGGEAEKYLFYRGVGNLPAPLSVARTKENDALVIRENLDTDLQLHSPILVRAMWLVHVRDGSDVAFRSLGSAKLTGEIGREIKRTPVAFGSQGESQTLGSSPSAPLSEGEARKENLLDDYSKPNLAVLRAAMRKELIADGLYDDEAEAMLKTWDLAYFKSPGLRLFYFLPQSWTDAVLPLRCSLLADVSRTMVGRIELVTPRQRELLQHISTGPVSPTSWFYKATENDRQGNEKLARVWAGKARLEDLGLAIPADYHAYVDLGRFRNALILDAHTRDPRAGFGRFVAAYNLQYYTPNDNETASSE